MSVEGIIERIISDAQKEAEKILDDARKEAQKRDGYLKEEAEKYYSRQKTLLEAKYQKQKEHAILNARLDMRKNLLEVRQKWMDRAFEEAYQRLLDQSMEEYGKILTNLVKRATRSSDEELIFGKKGTDREVKKLLDSLNKTLKASFTLSKKRGEFEWGLVLKKGKIETNLSIESLFKYKRNDLEQRAWEIFDAGKQS